MILNHEKNIENQGDTTFTDDTVMNNKNEIIDDTGVVDGNLTEEKIIMMTQLILMLLRQMKI